MKNILQFYKELSAEGEPEISFPVAVNPILKNLI